MLFPKVMPPGRYKLPVTVRLLPSVTPLKVPLLLVKAGAASVSVTVPPLIVPLRLVKPNVPNEPAPPIFTVPAFVSVPVMLRPPPVWLIVPSPPFVNAPPRLNVPPDIEKVPVFDQLVAESANVPKVELTVPVLAKVPGLTVNVCPVVLPRCGGY